MVDVVVISVKQGLCAQEPPEDREGHIEDGQAEKNNRNGHRYNGSRFLQTLHRQCAEHETDKETARVAEKDGCRIEIEAQETQNCACECDRNEGNKKVVPKQGDDEHDYCREQ